MTLRRRLLISYLVITLTALFSSFIILFVAARPFQTRVLRLRLPALAQQAARQVNAQYRQGATTGAILAGVRSFSPAGNTRLVFVDTGGRVLADSREAWTGHPIPALTARPDSTRPGRLAPAGLFEGPAGEAFLYASAPVGPPGEAAGYIAVVAPRSLALFRSPAEFVAGGALAGGAALVVSLGVGLFLARSLARPWQRLVAATGAAARGDDRRWVEERGPPEIKRIAANFNVMGDRVEQNRRAMRDFVSNVSHELKTPLTSIQGFSQAILEQETRDEAAQRRAAAIIHQEAERLAGLVEDLLDLARLDSGQVAMAKKKLDLPQILDRTLERLRPQAEKKQIQLVAVWTGLPPIVGDGDRLAQVFTNLLDNALRYTPPAGRIKITGRPVKGVLHSHPVPLDAERSEADTALSERGDFVEIAIVDTGPGLPAADAARIFERFYQIDKSRKRGKGVGLGLAIASEIVAAHGGRLWAESGTGGGAKFVVHLPVTEADIRTFISQRR